jgi:hypothetical protein
VNIAIVTHYTLSKSTFCRKVVSPAGKVPVLGRGKGGVGPECVKIGHNPFLYLSFSIKHKISLSGTLLLNSVQTMQCSVCNSEFIPDVSAIT